jgi:hypothetical protein
MRTRYLFAFFAVVAALLLPCAAHAQCAQFYCESFGMYDPGSNLIFGYSLYTADTDWAQLWVQSYVTDPSGNPTSVGSSMGYFEAYVSFNYDPGPSGIYGVWGYSSYQIEGWWEYDGASEYDVYVPPPVVINSCGASSLGAGGNSFTIQGSGFSNTSPSMSWSGNGGVDFLQPDSSVSVISDSQINVYADLIPVTSGGSITISVASAACVIAVAAAPPPPPQVTIACPPGVPAGGAGTCSVTISPSGSQVTLALATSTKFGQATFQGGATSTTISAPQTVTIEGVDASDFANNITLAAFASGNQVASASFSVVSVSIGLNTGAISSDDSASRNYLPGVLSGGPLGPVIYSDARGILCSVAVELIGSVTPSDYSGTITLQRDIVNGSGYFGSSYNGYSPSGPDNSNPNVEVTTPTGGGHVFDLDAPGINGSALINRVRTNFQETAVLAVPGSQAGQQVGSGLQYYTRSSCGVDGNGNPVISTTVPGDNQAGNGTTPLTWNLQ